MSGEVDPLKIVPLVIPRVHSKHYRVDDASTMLEYVDRQTYPRNVL